MRLELDTLLPFRRVIHRVVRLQWVVVLVLCSPSFHASQNPATDPGALESRERLRIDVNLVTVGVLVTDSRKRELLGLRVEDFLLYEDGRPQKLSFFSAERQPITLVLLLDKSNSMREGDRMEQVKRAAITSIERAHPDSEFQYFIFHHEVSRAANFTLERERVKLAISGTDAERSGSSFYDALIEALGEVHRARYRRQVIILITDGADQHSKHTLDEVVQAVQAAEAEVFMIGYFNREEDTVFRESGKTVTLISGQEVDNPRFSFKQLAEESGAECFFPRSESELVAAIEAISKDIGNQYTLAYYAPYPSNVSKLRRIQVKLNRGGARIRARKGYILQSKPEKAALQDQSIQTESPMPKEGRARAAPYESKIERKDGRVIYSEDFSASDTGWPNKKEMFCSEGKYHISRETVATSSQVGQASREGEVSSITHKTDMNSLVASNGPWLKDFSSSVNVELEGGSPHISSLVKVELEGGSPRYRSVNDSSLGEAGLVFRLNEQGYYAFLVSWSPKQKGTAFKLIRKAPQSPALQDVVAWTQDPNTTNLKARQRTIGIACRGNQIKLFINNALVAEVSNDSSQDGMVGMTLIGKGHAMFDDLLVEEIP